MARSPTPRAWMSSVISHGSRASAQVLLIPCASYRLSFIVARVSPEPQIGPVEFHKPTESVNALDPRCGLGNCRRTSLGNGDDTEDCEARGSDGGVKRSAVAKRPGPGIHDDRVLVFGRGQLEFDIPLGKPNEMSPFFAGGLQTENRQPAQRQFGLSDGLEDPSPSSGRNAVRSHGCRQES